MILIVSLFALAAVFGLTLIVPILQGKTPTRTFVFIHGGLAAVALVMLLLQFFKEGSAVPQLSVILFVIAALGGFVLFAMDVQKKPLPKVAYLIHAGLAITAFLILLFSVI